VRDKAHSGFIPAHSGDSAPETLAANALSCTTVQIVR
jgi:hypothetical protein